MLQEMSHLKMIVSNLTYQAQEKTMGQHSHSKITEIDMNQPKKTSNQVDREPYLFERFILRH